MLAHFSEEEVLVVGGAAPVGLGVGWAWRGGRSRRRRRRAGELLVEVGGWRRHAGRRRPPDGSRLVLRHLVRSLAQQHIVARVERQLVVQDTPSPLREAQRARITSHGRRR